MTIFGDIQWTLIGWFIKSSIQTLQQLIVIYIRGNFVYNQFIGLCDLPVYQGMLVAAVFGSWVCDDTLMLKSEGLKSAMYFIGCAFTYTNYLSFLLVNFHKK